MLHHLPSAVRIVEVGPRDGLQNETLYVPLPEKIAFIEGLIDAGLNHIELTSFVRKDAIPQLHDAAELVTAVKERGLEERAHFTCLVPNEKGMEAAIKAGMKEVAVFTATSETFSRRNINATIAESLKRFEPVFAMAKDHHIRVRGYLSTVFGCPYEGELKLERAVVIAERLIEMGAYEISFGDTIGIGNPKQVVGLLNMLRATVPLSQIAMHFHDTRGMAVANVLTSMEHGVRVFDSSAGGLGGCPYAKVAGGGGAAGNVATEDLVWLFEGLGIKTGIDLHKLARVSARVLGVLGKESPSKVQRIASFHR